MMKAERNWLAESSKGTNMHHLNLLKQENIGDADCVIAVNSYLIGIVE